MLLETHIQQLAEVIGHVCNAHSNWETVPRQVRRALLLWPEVLPILFRLNHCAFSDRIISRCYIFQRGVVNDNAKG